MGQSLRPYKERRPDWGQRQAGRQVGNINPLCEQASLFSVSSSFSSPLFRTQIQFQDTKRLISAIGVRFQVYLEAVITVFNTAMRLLLDSSVQRSSARWTLIIIQFATVVFGFIYTSGTRSQFSKNPTQRTFFSSSRDKTRRHLNLEQRRGTFDSSCQNRLNGVIFSLHKNQIRLSSFACPVCQSQ